METKHQIIQLLKGLYTVCRTSEVGYRNAADAVESATTRELFRSYADQRNEFAEELQSEIRFHSDSEFHVVPPVDSWKEIHEAIRSRDEQKIIRACERSEEALLRAYKTAMDRQIPWDVETVLRHQYSDIKQAYYFIGALEVFSNQFVV